MITKRYVSIKRRRGVCPDKNKGDLSISLPWVALPKLSKLQQAGLNLTQAGGKFMKTLVGAILFAPNP